MRILGFVVHDKACFCGWKDQNLGSVHENAYFCGRDVEKYRFCPEKADLVVQMGKRKMQVFDFQALAFCCVPGAGIEPARIAPLVFETSASTDSAIRA